MNRKPSCTLKTLPQHQWIDAAKTARTVNPANGVHLAGLLGTHAIIEPMHLALLVAKYWGPEGVKLTVGFLDDPPDDLRARILSHMNAWAPAANVHFVDTRGQAQVRIARDGTGYWSNLGTDILHIAANRPTMNLQGFTMKTEDSEFYRVVRHETGHTLGFPHEHMRQELVARIDPEKAIKYFQRTEGWSETETRAQVLTPLEQKSIIGTPPDGTSIMCYQIPGDITWDGEPIVGGTDINATDAKFAASVYPPGGGRSVVDAATHVGQNGHGGRAAHSHNGHGDHGHNGHGDHGHNSQGGVFAFAPGTDPSYVAEVLRAMSAH